MGTAVTPPLKWAPFPLGLPRMGGISAWAEPGQMGFQDGAETSWDLLLIRALGGEVHVWLQQVIFAWKRGRVGPRGGGGTEGLRWPGGEKVCGAAPQVGDPWRACQLGGLPCVTPSPQEAPLPGGRVRVGAASSILCGPGVREAEKSLPPCLPPSSMCPLCSPQDAPRSRTGSPVNRCAPGWGSPRCPALPLASECSRGEDSRQPSLASPLEIHLGGTASN